jgi:hypothetical protein
MGELVSAIHSLRIDPAEGGDAFCLTVTRL